MKKITLIIALIFISINVKAQDDAVYKEDTAKLVAVISANAFKPYIDQFAAAIPADRSS